MGKAKKFGAVELALLAAVAALVALAIYLVAPPPPQPGVTRENFGRVYQWMSLEEAETLFGQKGEPATYVSGMQAYYWPADDGQGVVIVFSTWGMLGAYRGHFRERDGTRTEVKEFPARANPLFDRLRRWLRL